MTDATLEEVLRDPDAVVTEESVRAWLAAHPPPADVAAIGRRFDVRDPRGVARARLVELATELHPDALVELLPTFPGHDPLAYPLYAIPGAALGAACARRKLASPDSMFSDALRVATVEAQGAYLRDAAAFVVPYEVGELGGWLAPYAAALPDWIRQAYAEALVAVIGRAKKHERGALFPYGALLDAPAVERVLRAAAKRAGLFELTLARLVAQGYAQCAQGVAALLADKKLGRVAAAALASMGAVGVAAAQAVLDAAGPKATAATALARTLVALPPAPHSLWAGEQYSLPRFGRDPRFDLRAPTGSSAPRHAPTSLDALQRAVVERPARDLLPPTGWADLVQIVALDPFLADLPRSYARALRAGRLGHGADPDALCAALDEARWDSAVTKHYPAQAWGLGWALLWADAGERVYRHAIGRFESTRHTNLLGAREYQLANALKEERPAWAPPLEALLKHYGADRHETAWLGPPAVLASIDAPAAEVELAAPAADLWIVGRVVGAARFTVRLRTDVTVTVDVAAQRWTVATPSPEQGSTPPLDAARGVAFAIEVARAGMYVGLDGAVIHGAFSELPATVSPVRVTAEGEGALVTALEVREKFTVRESEAAGALFVGLDAAQGYTEVAGQRSPAAAHCLAAAARLLDEPRATLARDALLTMEGDEVGPWQEHVRATASAPPAEDAPPKTPRAGAAAKSDAPAVVTDVVAPTTFTVRSFEDVVRVLSDDRLGAKARGKKPAVLRRGQTEHGDFEYASFAQSPATEDWSARDAVPYPVVYLSDDAPPFDDAALFVDAVSRLPGLCRKGRGTAANVRLCVDRDRYVVAALRMLSRGDDDEGWSGVLAAAWRVDEGWCWALVEGTEEPLRRLLGVAALPAQVEWKAGGRVVVGDW